MEFMALVARDIYLLVTEVCAIRCHYFSGMRKGTKEC